MFKILNIFLHHNNEEIIKYNYNSFVQHKNDIVAIHDYDKKGLDGSYIVPKDAKFQRPCFLNMFGFYDSDIAYINYIYYNLDKFNDYTHFLLCEYDCLCKCSVNALLQKYAENDITGSVLISRQMSWIMFNHVFNLDIPLFGIVPTAFCLIKKEAMFKIVSAYEQYLQILSKTNSECRLGTIGKILDLKIGQYDNELSLNIGYCMQYVHPFQKGEAPDNIIYHPSKKILDYWSKT